jgi:hypothetical protein
MRRQVVAVAVRGDYAGYQCPVTERWIEGRKAHKENLKRQGCRVFEAGEREGFERRKRAEERDFDRQVDATVEAFVEGLPTRRRERLFEEVASGATAVLDRR